MKRLLPVFFSLFLLPATAIDLAAVTAPQKAIVAQAIDPGFKNQIQQNTVTVVNSDGTSGLGILLGKQNGQYLVLTGKAVTQGNTALTIQTNDGQTYPASIDSDATTSDTNFSLLEFSSNANYVPAELNPAAQPSPQQEIFVVEGQPTELTINSGQIGQALSNSSELEQFSYTDNAVPGSITKAVFDSFGTLVGFSGAEGNSFTTLNSFLQQLLPEVTIAYDLKLPETNEEATSELTGELKALEILAKKITVKIQSSSGSWGSGVIVRRDGNTYTVLTSAHVVCEPDPKESSDDCADRTYQIITSDRESQPYEVDRGSIKLADEDIDLARLEFESEADLEVATLANYAPVSSKGESYAASPLGVKGESYAATRYGANRTPFPIAEEESESEDLSSLEGIVAPQLASAASNIITPDIEREVSSNPLQKYFVFAAGYAKKSKDAPADWQFSPGYGLDQKTGSFSIYDRTSFDEGYQLVYTCITYKGMSGGPILDIDGRVVGIHGKAEGEKVNERNTEVSLGYSLAIPIGEFNKIGQSLAKDLDLDLGKLNIQSNQPSITNTLRQKVINAILTTQISNQNASSCRWVERGNQQWRLLDYTAAQSSFQRAIDDSDPECDEFAWYGKGLSLIGSDFTNPQENNRAQNIRLEKYRDAAVAFQTASRLDPKFYAALRRESITWRTVNEDRLALDAINKAIDLEREQITLEELDRESSSLHNDKGALLAKLEQPDAAIAAYNKAIALDRFFHLPYYNRGLIAGYREEWKQAIAEFDLALKYDNTYAPAYFNRGNAYYASGNLADAKLNYEKAISYEPKYAQPHHNLGYIYDRQENYPAAIEHYTKAIDRDENYRRAYINRARVYAIQQNWSQAKADYDMAIDKLKDNNPQTYLSRGLVHSKLGQQPKAINDIRQAQMLFSEQGNTEGYEQAGDFLQQIQQ